jgi:hypothetical protein
MKPFFKHGAPQLQERVTIKYLSEYSELLALSVASLTERFGACICLLLQARGRRYLLCWSLGKRT